MMEHLFPVVTVGASTQAEKFQLWTEFQSDMQILKSQDRLIAELRVRLAALERAESLTQIASNLEILDNQCRVMEQLGARIAEFQARIEDGATVEGEVARQPTVAEKVQSHIDAVLDAMTKGVRSRDGTTPQQEEALTRGLQNRKLGRIGSR